MATETNTVPRLKQRYLSEIRSASMDKFKLKNVHQAPRLTKIVINMGVGAAIENKKRIESAMDDLAVISGHGPDGYRQALQVLSELG